MGNISEFTIQSWEQLRRDAPIQAILLRYREHYKGISVRSKVGDTPDCLVDATSSALHRCRTKQSPPESLISELHRAVSDSGMTQDFAVLFVLAAMARKYGFTDVLTELKPALKKNDPDFKFYARPFFGIESRHRESRADWTNEHYRDLFTASYTQTRPWRSGADYILRVIETWWRQSSPTDVAIVDLGCSDGDVMAHLIESGAFSEARTLHYFGYDISPPSAEVQHNRIEDWKRGLNRLAKVHIEFIEVDIATLSFVERLRRDVSRLPEGAAVVFLAGMALHHIREPTALETLLNGVAELQPELGIVTELYFEQQGLAHDDPLYSVMIRAYYGSEVADMARSNIRHLYEFRTTN